MKVKLENLEHELQLPDKKLWQEKLNQILGIGEMNEMKATI